MFEAGGDATRFSERFCHLECLPSKLLRADVVVEDELGTATQPSKGSSSAYAVRGAFECSATSAKPAIVATRRMHGALRIVWQASLSG